MDPAAREEMIAGMVDSPRSRVWPPKAAGEDWARLITSLPCWRHGAGRAILAEARGVFAGDEAAVARLRARGSTRAFRVICPDAEVLAEALPRTARSQGWTSGTVTIGVAVSDLRRRVATPLETVKRKKFTLDAQRLLEIAKARDLKGSCSGCPINMDGSEGPRAQSTAAFARNLERLPTCPSPSGTSG
jgi:hypothetical protein